jgi:hypothetical protein
MPLPFGAAPTLFEEKLLPILHGNRGLNEFSVEARLTGDNYLAAGGNGGAGACALGEVEGQLGVPDAGGFGHCALRGHAFFDRSTPIITLVRLHWSPLR